MIENLQSTVNSIFELYRRKSKFFYNFSLYFWFLSTLGTGFISAIILFLAQRYLDITSLHKETFSIEGLFNGVSIIYLGELSMNVAIISVSLYAIYLRKKVAENDEDKPSRQEFWKFISPANWRTYFVIIFIFCLIYVFSIIDFFNLTNQRNNGLIGEINLFSGEGRMMRLEMWIVSIMKLIRTYLPYLGAFYIILDDLYENPFRELVRKYNPAFWSFLVISFIIITLSGEIDFYIRRYIIALIKVPFAENIPVVIFQFVIYILLSSWFLLALAGSFLFPILHNYILQGPEIDVELNDFRNDDPKEILE